jgi:glycosyltransferase involved in cell wall biosynthesis
MVSILSRVDPHVVLVNSAHNESHAAPLTIRSSEIGKVRVTEVIPATSANRKIGKLRNIRDVKKVLRSVQELGVPRLYWFYNAYAFEMRYALKASAASRAPMVLELEDWPLARRRRWNPKPFLDYFYWLRVGAARILTHAFAVNSVLETRIGDRADEVSLLPGAVPQEIVNIATHQPPFASQDSPVTAGFFGGLSVEKGADMLLRLVPRLDPGYVLQVTGSGPLERDFVECSERWPGRLRFHGSVDEATLYELIGQTDVILNPHAGLMRMGNGVFPFKVVEAIASGRLLISTDLPTTGVEDLVRGVQFVPHCENAFLAAIHGARGRYLEQQTVIAGCAARADARFGEAALLDRVKKILYGTDPND